MIADAVGDLAVERVSVLKSARIGFSTVLTAAIARYDRPVTHCPPGVARGTRGQAAV